jgi:hypothetical protein
MFTKVVSSMELLEYSQQNDIENEQYHKLIKFIYLFVLLIDFKEQETQIKKMMCTALSNTIILFVLITGRQALVRAGGENYHILEWVMPIIKGGDIENVIDPRLQGEFRINSAWKVVEIAMTCISPNAVERPDISQILAELKESLSLEMAQREGHVIESASSLLFQSITAPCLGNYHMSMVIISKM